MYALFDGYIVNWTNAYVWYLQFVLLSYCSSFLWKRYYCKFDGYPAICDVWTSSPGSSARCRKEGGECRKSVSQRKDINHDRYNRRKQRKMPHLSWQITTRNTKYSCQMPLGCQDRLLRLNIVVLRFFLLINYLCKCTSLYPLSPTRTFHKFCCRARSCT